MLSLTSRGSRPTRLSSDVRGDAMVRVHVGDDDFVELGLRDGTLVVDRSEGGGAGVVDGVGEACDSWSVR